MYFFFFFFVFDFLTIGDVVTEKHLLPKGELFEVVSSPHMMFEVIMYAALAILTMPNWSMIWVFLWVLCNQIENAWLTHKWYLQTFPHYPKERKAIFPGML